MLEKLFNYKKYFKFIFLSLITLTIILPSSMKANKNEIIIATDPWPPFRIHEGEEYKGIDVDLWKEVAKRLDLKIKFKNYPWTRSLQNMKTGKVDAMSGVAKREERMAYLKYTTPSYFTCSTVFYVKKGKASSIKTYDDLKNHLIGQVANSAYFAPFDTDETLRKRTVTTEEQLIKMLHVGRLKVIIGTDCQADYDIAQLGYAGEFEKAEFKPGNNVDLYITISKKSKFAENISKIDKVIKEIIAEGKIKEFSDKYYK